jgi:transcriptional regulator with XRE-family HTH domain
MIIEELLKAKQMSKYRLSKESGIPQATLSDICSGKTKLQNCSAGTLYKIARVLNVTVDSLIEADVQENLPSKDYRVSFETFKSNTCHQVKDRGDLEFIVEILESDVIRKLYQKNWHLESLYLLGMLDYLSRVNALPRCTNYDDIRQHKLSQIVYPSGVLIQSAIMHNDDAKEEALKEAIPEFLQFNIVESEVRNIV